MFAVWSDRAIVARQAPAPPPHGGAAAGRQHADPPAGQPYQPVRPPTYP